MNLETETSYSDAAAMVDMCRQELERGGFRSQAEALKGLEVFDANGAEVALFTLSTLPKASGFAQKAKGYAAQALRHVLDQRRLAS